MGAAGLVGGIVAGMIANKFKTEKIYRLFWIMGISIAAFGSSLLFNLSANLTYIIFVIISIIIFISASIAGVYIMSAIQQNVPDNMLGRIMSFYSAIVSIALPIGILLYGYLYEKVYKSSSRYNVFNLNRNIGHRLYWQKNLSSFVEYQIVT